MLPEWISTVGRYAVFVSLFGCRGYHLEFADPVDAGRSEDGGLDASIRARVASGASGAVAPVAMSMVGAADAGAPMASVARSQMSAMDASPVVGAGGAGGVSEAAGAGGMRMLASLAPRCGNGVREGAELCDGADCSNTCKGDPANACSSAVLEGSAAMCDAHCVPVQLTACIAGDDCCPMGCDHGTDADCSPSCGDSVLSGSETCEPGSKEHPCPALADCDDGDVCTMDSVTGSATLCSAQCAHARMSRPFLECVDTDPCTDDTIVESTTACAYQCPHTRSEPTAAPNNCVDTDPCTDDTPVLSKTSCAYTCPHARAPAGTPCGGGKMCTSSGQCEAPAPRCGNGVREGDERCDGADCPTSCSDDGNSCTRDVVTGSAANCTAECSHPPVAAGTSCPGGLCDAAGSCQANAWWRLCHGNDECNGLQCVSGMCTRSCAADSDCPAAPNGLRSMCQGGGGKPLCQLADCQGSLSSNCPTGLVCGGLIDSNVSVCLPQPCGGGLVACAGDRRCTAGVCY